MRSSSHKPQPNPNTGQTGDVGTPRKTRPPHRAVPQNKKRKHLLLAALLCLAGFVLIVSLWQIFSIQTRVQEANTEYDQLRQQALPAVSVAKPAGASEPGLPAFDVGEIVKANPDCVGWIYVPDTILSYPVVHSSNNDKYLKHTFMGKPNAAGAIFLDARNTADLQGPHVIIYGHNMKDGSMFGLLPNYLQKDYLEAHSTLALYSRDQVYTYRIHYARIGDAYDPCYQLDFESPAEFSAFAQSYGAPADAAQMLTLSTCTNGDEDERILVHAYLVSSEAL